jgi:hypothetical protein
MPEPSRQREREFLPSANQALAELEAATGKPVLVLEAPELGVLATIRRAGPEDLTINDPSQEHHLRHYKGGRTVSALQAACILYVGIQLLLPGEDAGIDLGREYEMARGMVGGDV